MFEKFLVDNLVCEASTVSLISLRGWPDLTNSLNLKIIYVSTLQTFYEHAHISKQTINDWVNEWMNEWMNEWTNERTNELMNERTNEWMDEWTKKWKHKRIVSEFNPVQQMETNLETRALE